MLREIIQTKKEELRNSIRKEEIEQKLSEKRRLSRLCEHA